MTPFIETALHRIYPLFGVAALAVAMFASPAQAETPEQWIALGTRVHGGFGDLIAVGIRIGLDARQRLRAGPRQLRIVYDDGPAAPCSCIVDGIMLATVSTPGQDLLSVGPRSTDRAVYGIATIFEGNRHGLRYVVPASAAPLLAHWNRRYNARGRYDAVMRAPASRLFRVEPFLRP